MTSIIFYGAGQNLHDNFNRWYADGLHPVCIVDSNTSLHYTNYETPGGEIGILPLIEAIRRFPDYQLFITQHVSNRTSVLYYLLSFGIPIERIKTCEAPNADVSKIGLGVIGTSIYPQLHSIFTALADDLSKVLFWGRMEYNLSRTLTGVYKAMTHPTQTQWLSSKTPYAQDKYGLSSLWELLNDNYPIQKNEIYLYAGTNDAFLEYKWVLDRFLEAIPKLGITLSGCIMAEDNGATDCYMGIKCIKDTAFALNTNNNTRLIIGFPGWCIQTEDVIKRFNMTSNQLVPIADNAQPQYFENDIMTPNENEIFVDVGVFDLGSSIDFCKWASKGYEKIYAFEPDPTCYNNSLKRLKESGELDYNKVDLINSGLSYTDGVLSFPSEYSSSGYHDNNDTIDIPVTALDKFLKGKPVTFIKMDVEGSEMDVLRGMHETIKNHKPKLAVCIYHKHEDLLDISSFLLSLVPEYKLYIRHYNTNETETVLICTV